MRGFFDKERIQIPYKSEKGILSCVSCGLYKTAQTPKMAPYGLGRKKIMVIGEGPGEDDDKRGKPWQGEIGRVLRRKYQEFGINLFTDCISLNAVNCRPVDKDGNTRYPNDHEIACCRQKVIRAIRQYQPKLILLHGGAAVSSLLTGYRWRGGKPTGINAWRGWTIPDREFQAWICPTFHPFSVTKKEEKIAIEVIWTNDLRQAFSKLQEPFPVFMNEEDCVVISYDPGSVLLKILRERPSLLAFDIETTGIKPYNKEDHKIVSISFCWEEGRAFAIPFPEESRHFRLLKRILECPEIGKIAANMKYEDSWLNVLHNIHVQSWVFDTMQAAHILDNRPGITGLKFQSFVNFGLPQYDQEVSPYLQSKAPNVPNKIMDLVKSETFFRKLLLYNGIDSLMTYRLALKQMKEIGLDRDFSFFRR